jgi:DNA polymerase I-like protein with 3'-5' exonuclease and polymerase domains
MCACSPSDLMKIAMKLLRRVLQFGEPSVPADVCDASLLAGARLVLQIHDELIVECPSDPATVSAYVSSGCDAIYCGV